MLLKLRLAELKHGVPPPSPTREVMVLPRRRTNSPLCPASLCGCEREEWVQRRPTSPVI
jgi:hypothetical protein